MRHLGRRCIPPRRVAHRTNVRPCDEGGIENKRICFEPGAGEATATRGIGVVAKGRRPGRPAGQRQLGLCDHNGLGVKEDDGNAVKWFWLCVTYRPSARTAAVHASKRRRRVFRSQCTHGDSSDVLNRVPAVIEVRARAAVGCARGRLGVGHPAHVPQALRAAPSSRDS